MSYSIAKALRQNYNLIHHILMIIQCDDYTDSQSSVVSMIWRITNYYVNHYIMKQISTNVNLFKFSLETEYFEQCKKKWNSSSIMPVLQTRQNLYSCGEFDHIFQFQSGVCGYLYELLLSLSYWLNFLS